MLVACMLVACMLVDVERGRIGEELVRGVTGLI
jgi:hypothetical protein